MLSFCRVGNDVFKSLLIKSIGNKSSKDYFVKLNYIGMHNDYIDKDKLRTVEFKTLSKVKKGYFHLWFKEVGDSGSDYVYGLIELEDGSMVNRLSNEFKFTDRVEFVV